MAGLMYTIIGETQEDFVFGDKQEARRRLVPRDEHRVDQAITKLDKAVTIATEVNNAELLTRSLAVRARAKHSRAIWDKVKPTVNTAAPLVSNAGAVADANAVIGRVAATWRFQMLFSSATLSNTMASEINSRGESQFDTTSIVQVNKAAPKTILSVKLQDPIDKVADARILAFLREWKSDNNISVAGQVYAPLTVASVKHMRLILAEDALAKNDMAASPRTSTRCVRSTGSRRSRARFGARPAETRASRRAIRNWRPLARHVPLRRKGSALARAIGSLHEARHAAADHLYRAEREHESATLLSSRPQVEVTGRGPWTSMGRVPISGA
jgi:hypothetical protein